MENMNTEMMEQQNTNTNPQGENSGTATESSAADQRQGDSQKQEKTFTQEELDAIVQKRLADEKRRAEQRGLMSLAERETELAKRESEIRQKELKSLALETLSSRQLPASLADVISFSTEEELTQRIDHLETAFREAVQKGVEARFKNNGYTPRGTAAGRSVSSDDDAFTKGLKSQKIR